MLDGPVKKRLNGGVNPLDARRRWFGSFFLIAAIGLTIWGQTLLRDYLLKRPALFVVYWLAVFGCVSLAMLLALLDIFATRRRTREEQRRILEDSFSENPPKNADD